MKIKVQDIRPEGVEVAGQIAVDLFGLTSEDEGYFTPPFDVQAQVSRVNDTVLARTRVRGRYRSACARCLAEVEQDWNGNFLFDFILEGEVFRQDNSGNFNWRKHAWNFLFN